MRFWNWKKLKNRQSFSPARGASEVQSREAELVVVIFRTIILLLALLAPRAVGLPERLNTQEMWLAALAGTYNLMSAMACVQPDRYRLRRWLIVAMDMMLITLWIHLSGQWGLFAFYYLVVVVAAMWFRVTGGALAAIFANFFFLFLWLRMVGNPLMARPPAFSNAMALNMLILLLVGCLVGYISEIQEREREARLESQQLVDNYQREIELSAQLQPLLSGRIALDDKAFDLGSATLTARPFGGGDYVDCLHLPQGRIAFCIADVSGKSVRAQARLPLFKYALRVLAPLHEDAGELMQHLNAILSPDLQPELYITACYVIVDVEHGTLSWCNAGHVPALLYSPGADAPLPLPASGPALGMFDDSAYAEKVTSWSVGSCLLLHTDGLPDALDARPPDEGVEAMFLELATEPTITAQEVADVLLGEARMTLEKVAAAKSSWWPGRNIKADPAIHRDDITVLLVKRPENS